ncbi:MAG: DUF2254 domain-containing protein [Ginsengibacter sp.]
MSRLYKWLRKYYSKTINSIAFYPALISLGFLLLSVLMLELDFSETGKHIKSQLSWLSLRDASTARSILTTISGGIISLTVFSFSMVMILLNQAASQMSNRMLDSMIGNRFQQIILGFYIGTIVYSLFLLSTIRNITSGIYVPALSIYLLLLFTVVDIFLFIYFLHYVTQSVKFETIINRIHKKTLHTLQHHCCLEKANIFTPDTQRARTIYMPLSDYYQGFNKQFLIRFAQKHDVLVQMLHSPGSYLLEGSPLLLVVSDKNLQKEDISELMLAIDLYRGQPIDKNAHYGYHQLAEVAIKALSPGINDPETAVLSIHALTDLFRFRLFNYLPLTLADENKVLRVAMKEPSFEELFIECFYPIWNYGKEDRYIQNSLLQMMEQLIYCDVHKENLIQLQQFKAKIELQIAAGIK